MVFGNIILSSGKSRTKPTVIPPSQVGTTPSPQTASHASTVSYTLADFFGIVNGSMRVNEWR